MFQWNIIHWNKVNTYKAQAKQGGTSIAPVLCPTKCIVLSSMLGTITPLPFSPQVHSMHMGSQFPSCGWNPYSLQWKRRVLTPRPPRKSYNLHFLVKHRFDAAVSAAGASSAALIGSERRRGAGLGFALQGGSLLSCGLVHLSGV